MRTTRQLSLAVLMWLVVLAALEVELFQEFRFVRFMLLIPPITMAVLALNLGFLFLVIRPRLLEPRIAGMLMGGVAAIFVTVLGVSPWQSRLLERIPGYAAVFAIVLDLNRNTVPIVEDFQRYLLDRALELPDQRGLAATVVRFVSAQIWGIIVVLADILGVVLICAGGWYEHRARSRRARSQGPEPAPGLPLDGRAASPL